MGAVQSFLQRRRNNANVATAVAIKGPFTDPVDIMKLSSLELEHEFNRVYDRSQGMLGRLSSNPCERLTVRIRQCLEQNSMEMAKCFNVMDEYQGCVRSTTSEKIQEGLEKEHPFVSTDRL